MMSKKRFSRIVVILVFIAIIVTVLTGCDSLLKFSSKLTAPSLSVIGNTIYWEPVESASSYDVYKNNNFLTTVSDTYYIAEGNEADSQYYVIAKAAEGAKDSDKSDPVIIHKQSGFSVDEIMEIELSSNCYTVPANINCVSVTGNASGAYILVADRTRDLVIELNGVKMTSPQGKSCIMTDDGTYDASEKKYSVTIKVSGTNVLTGSDYTSVPATPQDNTGQKGTKGGSGGSGIILPNVCITGDGSLTLDGGNGGPGGTGAASSGWSTAVYGNGGDGGNGGCGIKTTNAVLAMSLTGVLKAYGGKGGSKGRPGSNGSILSGPWATAKWDSCYGSMGTDGTAIIGEFKQLSGVYST